MGKYFVLLMLHQTCMLLMPVSVGCCLAASVKHMHARPPQHLLDGSGALMAAAALDTHAAPAVLGLRVLNPYVAAALGDWRKRACLGAAVPRQYAPVPAPAGLAPAAGASSFGMGGTNAHLLAGAAPGPLAAGTQQPVLWQRSRHAASSRDVPCVQQ